MHVPSESFGGVSPERRAARSLQLLSLGGSRLVVQSLTALVEASTPKFAGKSFFTFVAARIVLSQLEGIGRSDLGSYNAAASTTLRRFLLDEPMRDPADWLARLMQENEMLGARILEVRAAYAVEDFEWDNLKRLAIEGLEADNTALLRQHATKHFTVMMDKAGSEERLP